MPDPSSTERHGLLTGRTTGDLLILLIASTVCFAVLASGAGLFIVSVLHPESDSSAGFHAIGDVINTLIGLLAGFLAGRTDADLTRRRQIDGLERHEFTE